MPCKIRRGKGRSAAILGGVDVLVRPVAKHDQLAAGAAKPAELVATNERRLAPGNRVPSRHKPGAVPQAHRPREQGSTTVKVSTIAETLRELWALRRAIARSGPPAK